MNCNHRGTGLLRVRATAKHLLHTPRRPLCAATTGLQRPSGPSAGATRGVGHAPLLEHFRPAHDITVPGSVRDSSHASVHHVAIAPQEARAALPVGFPAPTKGPGWYALQFRGTDGMLCI